MENDPALPDARVGTVLADRYRINALLGEGGMGKVYAAEHVLMRKRLAVKVLHRELTTVPEVVQRFEREAMAAANIEHANVAAATDFGKLPDGAVFLVLEYVQGRNLRDVIAEGPLPVARALHIARQVASALGSAHALRIVHRDLKPENVMLVEKSGDQDFVKVLDFGIAKVPIGEVSESGRPPGSPITKAGMVFGTPEYMAPEQALGQVVDGRADLFGLGVILYEMLAGVRPFSSHSSVGILGQQLSKPTPTFAERAPGLPIPEEVERIVLKLLDKEAGDRFQSADELVAAIDAVSGLPSRSLRRTQRSEGSLADLRMSREGLGERQELPSIPEVAEPVEPPTVLLANRPPAELPLPSFEGVPTMGVIDAKFQMPPTQLGLQAGDLPPPPAPPERQSGSAGTLQRLVASARTALGQQIAAALSWIDASREKWPGPVERALDPISARAILSGACLVVFGLVLTAVLVVGSLVSGPRAPPSNELAVPQSDSSVPEPVAAPEEPVAPPAVAPAPAVAERPKDAPGLLRLAEQQVAGNQPVQAVQSLTEALALDEKSSEDPKVAAALKKTAQIKASADASFALLQGPMGAAGADVIYELALAGEAGTRKRAESWLASAQFQKNSSPELNIAVALRQAASCSERQGLLLRARNVGDTRSLDYLKQWEATTGCGPQKKADCNPCLRASTLLKDARAAIEKRARSKKL